jgi:hypothetical protein
MRCFYLSFIKRRKNYNKITFFLYFLLFLTPCSGSGTVIESGSQSGSTALLFQVGDGKYCIPSNWRMVII